MSGRAQLMLDSVSRADLQRRQMRNFGGLGSPVEDGRLFAPRGHLGQFVKSIGVFSLAASAMVVASMVRRLPEGFAGLCLFVEKGSPDCIERARMVAVGPRTACDQPFPGMTRACIGSIIQPGATRAVFGVPAADLLNRMVPLELLWGASACELMERMVEARCRHHALILLEDAIQSRVAAAKVGEELHFANAAVQLLEASGGRLTVAELAARLGFSERQTRRCLVEHVGLSPKLYARTARLRTTVLHALTRSNLDLCDLAHGCGFTDQSHMTHEFAGLVGESPGQFLGRLQHLGPQQGTEGIFFLI